MLLYTRRSHLPLAFLFFISPPLLAQGPASALPPVTRSQVTFRVQAEPGPLTGTVREADGHPVWNAQVWVDRDSARGTWTGKRGRFTLPAPTPGPHQLSVRYHGLQPLVQDFTVLEHTGVRASIILAPIDFDDPGSRPDRPR